MKKCIVSALAICILLIASGCEYGPANTSSGVEYKFYAVFQAKNPDETDLDKKIAASKAILLYNLNVNGLASARVTRKGKTSLRVEIPDTENPDGIFHSLGKVVKLEIVDPEGFVILYGFDIADAAPESRNGEYVVKMKLNEDTTEAFAKSIEKANGQNFKISLDGKTISSPSAISPAQGGGFCIAGNFSRDEAARLAEQLKSFTIPAEMEIVESGTIG